MSRKLFANATVVSASGRARNDVLVEDGTIAAVLEPGDRPAAGATVEVIDCTDMFLLPGGVDAHTHLDSPVGGTTTVDDFVTGTVAAACGGTTTIIDFATQQPGQPLPETLETWLAKAAGRACIDYSFHISITNLYRGYQDHMQSAVADGVSSFKVFMAYPGTLMLDDGELFEVFRTAGNLNALTCIHAENGPIIDRLAADLHASGKTGPRSHLLSRPPQTEVEAVERAIRIGQMAHAPLYFVHLSTSGAVDAVAASQIHGEPVLGETCTHYLTLTNDVYDDETTAYGAVLTPPLREQSHQDALWAGLAEGALSVVSSDHCPFCLAQKTASSDFRLIPNGGPGIEHRLQLTYGCGVPSGRISLERFVDLTATTPATTFGLYPRKGEIRAGADADLVVLDPCGTTRISKSSAHQRSDYSLWEGWEVPGNIAAVYLRGDLIARDGIFLGTPGAGNFVRCAPL